MLMMLSYIVAAVGFALSGKLEFKWVCLLAVGVPTAAGFIRHFFLWRGDAARLGFGTPDPSWMWEVAFANLALCAGSIVAFFIPSGLLAQIVVTIMMGVYMLGATFVHVRSERSKPAEERRPAIVAIWIPLAYALVLFYVAWVAYS